MAWWIGLAWTVGGFILGSLSEYWGHRLMHSGTRFGRKHRDHHATGEGQGVWPELFAYLKVGAVLMIVPFFVSLEAGMGFAIGATLFAFFSAFAHQLQHDNPGRCFWMTTPIHHVHHKHQQWHNNFGMAVDWWDRIFGTYKAHDDWRKDLDPALVQRSMLDIQWIGSLRRANREKVRAGRGGQTDASAGPGLR